MYVGQDSTDYEARDKSVGLDARAKEGLTLYKSKGKH